jgi:uncharacterized beta-barrel protein YwiB (DUF1934 family)
MNMKLKVSKQHADNSRNTMETRDHSKNGACPKSQMNRGNFLKTFFIIGILCISFASCKKDKDSNGIFTSNVSSTIWNITSLSGTGDWFKQYSDDGVLTFDESLPFKIACNTDKTCHLTFLRDEKYNEDNYNISSTGTWTQNNNSITFNIVWKCETPEGVQVNEFKLEADANQKASVERSGNVTVKGNFIRTGETTASEYTEGSGTFAGKQESIEVASPEDVTNTTWRIVDMSNEIGDNWGIGDDDCPFTITFNADHSCSVSIFCMGNGYVYDDYHILSTGSWVQNKNSLTINIVWKEFDDYMNSEYKFDFKGTLNSSTNMSGSVSFEGKAYSDGEYFSDSKSGTFVANKLDEGWDGSCPLPKVYPRTDWLKSIQADNDCDRGQTITVEFEKLMHGGRIDGSNDYWVSDKRTFSLRPFFYGVPILFPAGEVKAYRNAHIVDYGN